MYCFVTFSLIQKKNIVHKQESIKKGFSFTYYAFFIFSHMLSFYKKEVKAHDYNAHDNRLLNAPPEARSSGEDKRLHRAFVNYSGGKCACRVQFPFCCLQAVLSDDQTLPVWARKSDTPSVRVLT